MVQGSDVCTQMGEIPEITSSPITVECDRTSTGREVATVVAELSNGVVIRLRVPDHILAVGEIPDLERELTILAHPTERVAVQEAATPRIVRPAVWPSQWSADLYGTIKDIQVEAVPRADSEFDILDVGVGTVFVHPKIREHLPASALPLRPGDELYVPASPLVLWDCYP